MAQSLTDWLQQSRVIVVGVLMAVGLVPTRRLAGDAAPLAMAVGCGISFASAALAGWLLTAVRAETPAARMQRAFLAMVVRLAVVVGSSPEIPRGVCT